MTRWTFRKQGKISPNPHLSHHIEEFSVPHDGIELVAGELHHFGQACDDRNCHIFRIDFDDVFTIQWINLFAVLTAAWNMGVNTQIKENGEKQRAQLCPQN